MACTANLLLLRLLPTSALIFGSPSHRWTIPRTITSLWNGGCVMRESTRLSSSSRSTSVLNGVLSSHPENHADIVCDPEQENILRKGKYRELTEWYEQHQDTGGGIACWGVQYTTYRDEYAAEIAKLVDIQPGARVYESACGAGWLLQSLKELLPSATQGCTWFGNDILDSALEEARYALPQGLFFLADSMNLTWIAPSSFDVVLCGYLEPKPDCTYTDAPGQSDLVDWYGGWVAQMTRLAKPGAQVCIGALQLNIDDGLSRVNPDWWYNCARTNEYDWAVDPESVTVKEMDSSILEPIWGPRYHVLMRRRRETNEVSLQT